MSRPRKRRDPRGTRIVIELSELGELILLPALAVLVAVLVMLLVQ